MAIRHFYTFIGDNNSISGKPNSRNGKYSKIWELKLFRTMKARNEYCKIFDSKYNCYPVQTNAREARLRFFAGMNHRQYEKYLDSLSYQD